MQTRERAHCARSVFPFIKKTKKKTHAVFIKIRSVHVVAYLSQPKRNHISVDLFLGLISGEKKIADNY